MRRGRLLGAWLVVAAGALVAGCDPFVNVRPGECGNNIVEPARGEDCDSFERADMACRPLSKDDPLACRFDCRMLDEEKKPVTDGRIEPSRCADGWTCGPDGVCRSAKAEFETIGTPLQESATGLIPGDFDGDAQLDILSVGTAGLSVHFLDEGGAYARSVEVPAADAHPAVGDLSGDGLADFTMSTSVGLGVQRGQTSRELEPVVFPLLKFPDVRGLRLLPVVVKDPLDAGKDKVEIFAVAKTQGEVWALSRGGSALVLGGKKLAHATVGPAAPLSLPCEKIAIALADPPSVQVHAPCDAGGLPTDPMAQPPGFPRTVTLTSAGFEPRRVFFHDLNADGVPDLVISAFKPGEPPVFETEVALGAPDGSYMPASSLPKATSELLAIGYIDDNADADFVLGDGVYLNWGKPMSEQPAVDNKVERWTEAVIIDLDLNGQADVIAASDRRPNIDFVSGYDFESGGDPPIFTRFLIPTVGGVEQLTAGNFDGDLLPDVAFAEIPLSVLGGKRPARELAVAFGELFSTPDAPAYFGRFDLGIEQILATYLPFDGVDASLELGVVALRSSGMGSQATDATVSIFQGNSERLLQAAKILSDRPEDAPPEELALAARYDVQRSFVGRFDVQAADDDASADLAVIAFNNKEDITQPLLLLGKVQGDVRASFSDATGLGQLPKLHAHPISRVLLEGVVADLDKKTPTDDLVLSIPVPTKTGALGSALYRAVPNGTGWELTKFHEAEPFVVLIGLRAADIDRDGSVDIAAMKVISKGQDDQNPTYQPVVFWGDDGGKLSGPEGPNMGGAVLCNAFRPFQPSSLAVIEAGVSPEDRNADPDKDKAEDEIADRTKELVLADPSGAYLITIDVDVAKKIHTFSAPQCMEKVPGGNVVMAADITGDGVEDLVVGAPGSTYLVKGIARRP